MDFTREPIIETVITPKEGCKLVIRSSKGVGQEEYFVDAVEVVTFGNAIFFRSVERPKPFLVPASDYDVLEVREARIVLKNVGIERSIKIGGGREANMRPVREPQEEVAEQTVDQPQAAEATNGKQDPRTDRKRDRRRQSRKRRDRTESSVVDAQIGEEPALASSLVSEEGIPLVPPLQLGDEVPASSSPSGSLLANLLAPPPLISETIARYKERFKDAFYTKEEQASGLSLEADHPMPPLPEIPLEQPAFGAFELSEEAEEEIYRQRHRHYTDEPSPEESNAFTHKEEPSGLTSEEVEESTTSEDEVPMQEKKED